MKVTIQSKLPSSFKMVVENIKKSALLHHVAYPLVIFSPDGGKFPEEWATGIYWTKISLFGVVPFSKQAIVISFPNNEAEFCLRDNGHSSLIKKWDHLIKVKTISNHEVLYEDSVEIQAGFLTPLIWMFAYIFYSYRQYRLRRLVNSSFSFSATR